MDWKGPFVTHCAAPTQLQLNLPTSSDSEMNGRYRFSGKIVLTGSIELSVDNKSVAPCLTGGVFWPLLRTEGSFFTPPQFHTFTPGNRPAEPQSDQSATQQLRLSSWGLRAVLKSTSVVIINHILLSHFPH